MNRLPITFPTCLILIGVLFLAPSLMTGCGGGNAVDGDTVVDGDTTVDGDTPDGDAVECVYPGDCGTGDCVGGRCIATKNCIELKDCPEGQMCAKDKSSGSTVGHCKTVCVTDMECPTEGICIDGQCLPAHVFPTGAPVHGPDDVKAPLKARLATGWLDFPMTVTLGGYGARYGKKSPYSSAMGGSTCIYDRAKVKALTLDDGRKRVTFIRLPMIFATDFLTARVNEIIIQKTGLDLYDGLIFTSTHTHHMPARFWNIMPGRGFGALGMDDFQWDIFERLAQSIAAVVIEAQNDLVPAAWGYASNDNFDPDNTINNDRRPENPRFKDPRLFVMRIDDLSSGSPKPMVMVMNFAIHGTIDGNRDTCATQDSAGGAEMVAEERFEAETGMPITAIFLQGMAGDVSPVTQGRDHQLGMANLGQRVYPKARALYDAITPTDDVSIDIASVRIPISREYIGYQENEFYSKGTCTVLPADDCWELPDFTGPFTFGAFQCGLITSADPDTLNHSDDMSPILIDGELGCMLNPKMINGAPMPQFNRTRLTALRLNDLIVSTLPGEPMSKVGWELVSEIKAMPEVVNAGIREAVVLGYSQDHHFYLTLEDDWFRGGYEAQMSMWGPKFARYCINTLKALTARFATGASTADLNYPRVKPLYFDNIDRTMVVPTPTTAAVAGTIVDDVPATVRRMQQVRFHWLGGHPGVDFPHVYLERQQAGEWTTMTYGADRVYDDSSYRMRMDFENPSFSRATNPDENRWWVTWEETKDFPLGTYRFRIEGNRYTETTAAFDETRIAPYQAYTSAFELQPAVIAVNQARLDRAGNGNVTLSASLRYPSGPTTDPGSGQPFDNLEPKGMRLHDIRVPDLVGGPVDENLVAVATASIDGSSLAGPPVFSAISEEVRVVQSRNEEGVETFRSFGGMPGLHVAFPAGLLDAGSTHNVFIEVADSYGNTGSYTGELTVSQAR